MAANQDGKSRWWQWLVLGLYLSALAGVMYGLDHWLGWKSVSYWQWLVYLSFLMAGTAGTMCLMKVMERRENRRRGSDDQRREALASERERILIESRNKLDAAGR